MVDESRPFGEPPQPHEPGAHWLARLLLGALGVAAVQRAVRGRPLPPAAVPPPVVPAPPPPPEEEVRHADGRIEHPHVRFDPRDASFRGVLYVLLVMAALSVVHFLWILWYFHHREADEASAKRSPFPLQPAHSTALPAGPRLEQVNRLAGIESGDVFEREASREQVLHSYGPTPETGFLHVPIERAMTVLADQLPARKDGRNDRRANGLVDAGESNAGRMFREKAPWYAR